MSAIDGPVRLPPRAPGAGLPWDIPVDDAVAAIAAARTAVGDTFTVRSGDTDYLFTFSPVGVESFYALPEETASKGLADFLMLRRKLPDEIFDGRRTLPGTLFRREDVASEVADIAILLFEFADNSGIDLAAAVRAKLARNEERYPVAKARGSNKKYNEL